MATMGAGAVGRTAAARTEEQLICGRRRAHRRRPPLRSRGQLQNGVGPAMTSHRHSGFRRPQPDTAKRTMNNTIGGGAARHNERMGTGPASTWWRRD
ncbi:MAG: hypothetical protein JWO98_1268 [Frankiales bacterium]|nr:hypothetical protein [Frankiales bacterium]